MLFKISQGKEVNLPEQLTEGYCYYCVDTHDFWVDHKDSTNTLVRNKLSAEFADKLRYEGTDGAMVEIDPQDIVLLSAGDVVLLSELDTEISDTSTNAVQNKVVKAAIDNAKTSANSYTDEKTKDLASNSSVDQKITTHNSAEDTHNDIRGLISELNTQLNNFLDVDDTTKDQLSEVLTLIENNKGTIESLTSTKVNVSDIIDNLTTSNKSQVLSANQGVVIKGLIDALQAKLDSHGHPISDIEGLQTALDGKAASSHGTHVTFSSTVPVMDGTASVGSGTYVARSNHRHPTDTSRAAQTDLDALVTTVGTKAAASDLTSHTNSTSNPHSVTLSQLGVTATATELNKMDGVTATTTELNYIDGVTSNIQTQLDGKQATISGGASTIASSNLTASRALVSNSSGKVAVSAVTSTELGYLDGVTSAIQGQLDSKSDSGHTHSNYVPTTRTVNSKALSSNITLSASDVGADAAGTASSAVSTHNSDSSAHSDIRNSITVKYDQGVKIYTSANWVHRNYVEFANGLYYTNSDGSVQSVYYASSVDEWSGGQSLPTGIVAYVYE